MFSQTPPVAPLNGPFIILSSVQSTNNYAMAKLHAGMLVPGTSILAIEQTAGKGQRGKEWNSPSGENITMTTVYPMNTGFSEEKLTDLLSFPFLLSVTIALGCYDFIKAFNIPGISIKWPNDLYINDRKAGGILIENQYQGKDWLWSVIGTGINLNQTSFGPLQDKATSIKQFTGSDSGLIKSAKELRNCIESRLVRLQKERIELILEEYNSLLYKKGETIRLKKESMVFTTKVDSVSLDGRLNTTDTMPRSFEVGEVEFVTG